MNILYNYIDEISDDTIARKVNSSDASAFAKICGCFPSRGSCLTSIYLSPSLICHVTLVWGVIWLIQAIIFFVAGIIVGLVAFKVSPPVTFFLQVA
jgi:hypothetical protein